MLERLMSFAGKHVRSALKARTLVVEAAATVASFDDKAYLAANPDVAAAISGGSFASGREHFLKHGQNEARWLRWSEPQARAKARKRRRMRDALLPGISWPADSDPGAVSALTAEQRERYGVVATENVSSNNYDPIALGLIHRNAEGLVLDCGAGLRSTYYQNVVNYEIVDYPSTDVLGVAEELPFRTDAFDAVISIAVLEHVRDPFRAAAEIVRVLRPGGTLYCCVPFLQPLHGYPNHYYNMTHEGLRNLFSALEIGKQDVPASTAPIWSLSWIVQSWAAGLPPEIREQFLAMPLRELCVNPLDLLAHPWVTRLSTEKNFELASATTLLASKPVGG